MSEIKTVLVGELLGVVDLEKASRDNLIQTAVTACIQPLHTSELAKLNKVRTLLLEHRASLFDCESITKNKIDLFLRSVIAHRMWAIENLPSKYPEISERYPYFDYKSALSWRDNNGYPLLAIHTLDDNICEISVWRKNYHMRFKQDTYMKPNLPGPIKSCFKDVREMLMERGDREFFYIADGQITVTSIFKWVMPDDCRQAIVAAQKYFDSIFILAQAVWVEQVFNPDPLVVGYKDGHTWLITTFDLTSLEKSLVNCFSQKLLKGQRG